MTIRCGTICYACQSGLGILAKSFYDHGIVNDAFVVEHSHHPTQWSWYLDAPHCPIRKLEQNACELRRFVDGLDILLCFETPFFWPIVSYAKSKGVKTVCMPMYECSLTNPPATFDEYWCPSLLDLRYFSEMHMPEGERVSPFETYHGVHGSVSRFTPVPVEVEWKQRHTAKVFVHNAGHGGLKGRNGTNELVEALSFAKSPATFLIRSQEYQSDVEESLAKISSTVDVHYSSGTRDAKDLYTEGDIFLFPEKFNGLSLPLQEARAAGMLVMSVDRYPMNTWLPDGPLIPVVTTVKNRIGPPYMEFDEAVINPRMIAEKIDEFYGVDIHEYSLNGLFWSRKMSWDVLGPKYLELLEGLK